MDKGMELNAQPAVLAPVKVWCPITLSEAWKTKKQFGKAACFIAGGTLLQLQREQGIPFSDHLISLEQVEGIQGVEKIAASGDVKIGGTTLLAVCLTNPVIQQEWPLLAEAAVQVASPAVRNRATIGGNIVYGIGDTLPALLALDAEVHSFNGTETKESLLVYLGSTVHTPHILTAVTLPKQAVSGGDIQFYQKVGRREAFIPSIVTVACYGSFDLNNKLSHVRLVAGGGASKPQRLFHAERILQKNKLTEQLLGVVYQAIMEEYQPAADGFASGNYRRKVAANLIVRELDKHTADGGERRETDGDVR